MLQEFKQFVLRGNVVDLAVAVVIGAAFGAVVTSFVTNIVTPLIAAAGGQPDFSELDFHLNGSRFTYGAFINSLVSFVIIAAVVFFLAVKPINALSARAATREDTPGPTTRKCPECVSEIPLDARRCAFCTSRVEPVPPPASV